MNEQHKCRKQGDVNYSVLFSGCHRDTPNRSTPGAPFKKYKMAVADEVSASYNQAHI